MQLPVGLIVVSVLVMASLSTALFGARMSMNYFSSVPMPEGDREGYIWVPFAIGSDGRRIDQLPSTPLPQRMLGLWIWLIAVGLLMFSTHSDVASTLITLLALCGDHLVHQFNTMLMRQQAAPNDFRPLMSRDAYDQQG